MGNSLSINFRGDNIENEYTNFKKTISGNCPKYQGTLEYQCTLEYQGTLGCNTFTMNFFGSKAIEYLHEVDYTRLSLKANKP